MAIPTYASTGISSAALVDTWSQPDLYLDPIESDFEGGNKRLRAQPGDAVEHIMFDILYSLAEYATLKTFLKTTLNSGSSRFTMSVWNGSAYAVRTVQIAKKPVPQGQWPKIRVKWDLWVLP